MASMSFGASDGDALQDLDRLVAAVGGVEIGGKLDLRVALERRTGRHALVDLDRHLGLLHGLIEIGERQQRQRMIGLQVERELQIDQRQVLAAAAGQRGADAVQRLGRAGLRRIDQRRQLLAGLGVAQPFLHQRMPRQLLVERFVNAGRRRAILVARQPARIGVGHAQHRIVELVGALEPRAGILVLARDLEDHAGVEILEDRIPFRAGQLVDTGDRRLGIARAVARPARQQRRHQVGDRPADRLVDVELRGRIFLLLEVAHADHQPRDAVRLVHRQDAIGKLDRFIDVAIGQRGDEGAVQQFVVLRIGAQRGAIECRGGSGVALDAGVARGQIAAGRRQRISGRTLLGNCAALSPVCSGVWAKTAAGAASAARVIAAKVQRFIRVESITFALLQDVWRDRYDRSRMQTQAAASRAATMPLLALQPQG